MMLFITDEELLGMTTAQLYALRSEVMSLTERVEYEIRERGML